MCHELRLAVPPHDGVTFNFRCEQEAWEWATVLTSSLREAQKGQSVLPTEVPDLFRQSRKADISHKRVTVLERKQKSFSLACLKAISIHMSGIICGFVFLAGGFLN